MPLVREIPEDSVVVVLLEAQTVVRLPWKPGWCVLDYTKAVTSYTPNRRCELNNVHCRHSAIPPRGSLLVLFRGRKRG